MKTIIKGLLAGAVLALISNVAIAGKPVQPPAPGDITAVNAGAGLQGGGTSGDVTLSLKSCAAGQVLVWSGAAWECLTGGDITSVTAGSGLTGGGNSGAVSLSLPNCATGEVLRSTGTGWACESLPGDVAPTVPVIVDATGKTVGPVVPATEMKIYFNNRDTLVPAAIYRYGGESIKVLFAPAQWSGDIRSSPLHAYWRDAVFFSLPNCTGNIVGIGDAFLGERLGYSSTKIVVGTATGRFASKILTVSAGNEYTTVASQSMWDGYNRTCSSNSGGLMIAVSASEDFPFTPPFRIE